MLAEFALNLVPDLVKSVIKRGNRKCEIRLAPEIHPLISYPMNGGVMQQLIDIQVRFGSDSHLELVDAILSFKKREIRCEEREIKLSGGRDWNNFGFRASELTYVPDEVFSFRIRVCDHLQNCCELSSDMQMKQFPHPDYTGIKSGRWELHPKGIFNIKCSRRKKF